MASKLEALMQQDMAQYGEAPPDGDAAATQETTPQAPPSSAADKSSGVLHDAAMAVGGSVANIVENPVANVAEIPFAVVGGVEHGVNELMDSGAELLDLGVRNVTGAPEFQRDGSVRWLTADEWSKKYKAWEAPDHQFIPDSLIFADPTTVTGKLTSGVAQFVTGYALGGRTLKVLGFGAKTIAGSRILKEGIQSVFSGMFAFAPDQERLSNLIEKYPSLANPVTEFLSADPNDSVAEGRLKSGLEAVLGEGLYSAFFHTLKGLKAARGGNVDAAHAESENAAKALTDNAPEPSADEKGKATPRAKSVFDAATPAPGSKDAPTFTTPNWSTPDRDELFKFTAAISGDGPPVVNLSPTIQKNLERLNAPDDVRLFAKNIGDIYAARWQEVKRGPISETAMAEEGLRQVNQWADELSLDPHLLLQKTTSDLNNVRELISRVAGYRAVTNMAAQQAQSMAKRFLRGDLGDDQAKFLIEFDKSTSLLASIAPMEDGINSEFGRGLRMTRANPKLAAGAKGGLPEQAVKEADTKVGAVEPTTAPASESSAPKADIKPDKEPALQFTTSGSDLNRRPGENHVQHMDRVIEGGYKRIAALASRLELAQNVKSAKKIVNADTKPGVIARILGVHNEYWINMMLSSMKTQIVNFTANAMHTVYLPGLRMLAGATHMDKQLFMEGVDTYVGLGYALADGWRVAKKANDAGQWHLHDGTVGGSTLKAFAHDGARLDPHSIPLEQNSHNITSELFGLGHDDPLGYLVNGFGTLTRMPGRVLTTSDELIKQLNYRGRLYSLAMKEARAQGFKDEGMNAYVAQRMDAGFDAEGRALDKDALRYAQEASWTQDLEYGLGQSLQNMVMRNPEMRLILPFVRTPTNLIRDAWQHTPGLNMLEEGFRNEYRSADPQVRAMAHAKIMVGSVIWTTALMLAYEGVITGSGPNDPRLKASLPPGFLPNAFRVKTANIPEWFRKPLPDDNEYTYIQFSRFDPMATIFGQAGDFVDIAKHMPEMDQEEFAKRATLGVAKNLASKTYLSGVVEWMHALSDKESDNSFDALFRKQAGSYVPSLLKDFSGDELLRSPRTMLDAQKARTPGYGDVDLVFNAIGEPVNAPVALGPRSISPIAMQTGKADPVMEEVGRLIGISQGGLQAPPPKEGTVDLRKIKMSVEFGGRSAYDRLQELTGTIKLGGKTLRQTLASIIASPAYEKRMTDGDDSHNGTRMSVVQQVIRKYREASRVQLMKESPDYLFAIRQDQLAARRAQTPTSVLQPQQ